MSSYSCSDCEYNSGSWKQDKVFCYAKDDYVVPVEIYDKCESYTPTVEVNE